jgi:hypothetical protein
MIENIRSQLAANPRLRIGLALILSILGIYLVLDKSEQFNKQLKEYRRVSFSLAQARQEATDTSWVNRAKVANDALSAMRQSDWIDSSHGLIQSKWNDALQTLLTQEKAVNASVTLSDSVAEPGTNESDEPSGAVAGVTSMRAKLRFEAAPKSLYTILQVIENGKQLVVVDTLNYQWLGTVGRAEINLRTFARIADQMPAADDGAVVTTPLKGN